MAKNKEILYAAIIILSIVLIAMFFKYSPTFAITEDDLMANGTQTTATIDPLGSFDSFSDFYIDATGNTITFMLNNANVTRTSPAVFYMLDNSPIIYDTFQDLQEEGTHTLRKYQMTIWSNQVQIIKWEKTYDIIIRTIYQNVTIPNETFYIDRYVNQTINNTVYVNQTINNTITITKEPDLNAWVQKYQLYLYGIIGVGIVYYLSKRRKKR
jgi:hypothetical protein